jgi:hypothetical protein
MCVVGEMLVDCPSCGDPMVVTIHANRPVMMADGRAHVTFTPRTDHHCRRADTP